MSTGGLIATFGYNQFLRLARRHLPGSHPRSSTPERSAREPRSWRSRRRLVRGCTAQLGAMRISEEIDALEVMGIRAVSYLVGTRIARRRRRDRAAVCVALLMGTSQRGRAPRCCTANLQASMITTSKLPGALGSVQFLCDSDDPDRHHHADPHLLRLHRYGGSGGSGAAVGRATRLSLIVGAVVLMLLTLAIYGQTGNFNFAGCAVRDTRGQSTWWQRFPAGWLATLLVVVVGVVVALSLGAFNRSFSATVPVTLVSDRSGLIMEPYAKVKMRGVQVGRVADVSPGTDSVSLRLDIDPDQIKYIPANVEAKINATTLFGAKFVDLIDPQDPSPKRLAAGAVLRSRTWPSRSTPCSRISSTSSTRSIPPS